MRAVSQGPTQSASDGEVFWLLQPELSTRGCRPGARYPNGNDGSLSPI